MSKRKTTCSSSKLLGLVPLSIKVTLDGDEVGEQAQVADISELHFEKVEDFPEFSEPLDGKLLLFMYDCESTGSTIYQDDIVEIAAVILAPDDVTISETSFSQLCKTSLPVSTVGNNIIFGNYNYIYSHL